ncbi:MAG TPA: DUF6449 domain-containing protein, partial [Lachnospiraceae bacterium]|nr:DUF6449 domain-containing protein [Lachnospiraceae bacterium]
YESSNSTEAWKSAAFISPVTSFDFFINSCSEYSDVTAGQQTGHLLLTLVFAAVLFIPAIYLYKKRPSEAAGKALAFQKTEVFIRIPIVIVSALVGGIVFVSINNYSKSNWFWFGLIFTGILCHCLIEIIYRFDFKAFWNHKIQLLCCLAAAILIGLIYRQDLTGYDTYLPAKEDIKSTSVVFTNIDNDLSGFQFESVDKEKFVSGKYGDRISELLRNASFSDTDAVYALGKLGIENLELMEEEDQVLYSSAREISVASAGDTAAEESTATPLYYSVRYTLKNGKTRYRNYAVSVEDVSDAFARVYNNKEYKENSFDIFPMTEENAFRKVEVYDVWGTKQLSLTDGEMNSFLEAYEADFLNLSGETLETEVPVARLSPIFREKDCAYDDSLGGYYIYPSFIKTMTAMRELGVDLTEMKTSFDPEDLESIKVNDCGYLSDVLGITDGYSEGKLYVNSDVQDKQMIEELCGDLVNSNYAWSNMVLCPFE